MHFGGQNLSQPPDAGLLQRAWNPSVRPRPGQTAQKSGPVPSGKKQEFQDSCDRNAVEGIFRTAKTAYGLGRITARLQDTTALLLLNFSKSLRAALALILPSICARYFAGVAE